MKSITKRIFILCVLLLIAGQSIQLFSDESEFFFKSVPIMKIYPHRLGYRILYARTNMEVGDFYVPLKWFQYTPGEGGVGKGELVVGMEDSYPYFSIFWKNGEFDHIRLYLKKDRRDPSWGDLPSNVNIDDKFDVDTLNLEF